MAAADERLKAITVERSAKDAPFLKDLNGVRLRIFEEELGGMSGEWFCLGRDGALMTPGQMKTATGWFTDGSNNRGLIDTWHITGFRFQGDKLVGRISKTG